MLSSILGVNLHQRGKSVDTEVAPVVVRGAHKPGGRGGEEGEGRGGGEGGGGGERV